ncbi:MAG TPA: S53 family peptidase [Solirubrobacteraceae bacterium]
MTAATAAAAVLAVPANAFAATPPGAAAWGVSGARDLGPLPARPMTFTLVLTPRNAGALKSFVSAPHAALTGPQFNSRYAPAASTVSAIGKWAAANRLAVQSVSANRLLMSLSGSSTAVGNALHTTFHTYSTAANGTFYRPTGAAQLPSSIAGDVGAVLGLSSLSKVTITPPAQRSGAARNHVLATPGLPSSLNYPASYGPQDLWKLYNAPSSQTGSGQQLAIITEGNVSQPQKDLATFEQHYGLPTVTWNQINVGTPSSDTSGDDEWDLDSQYSTGFAPGVTQLNVYVGPSLSDADILTTINRWVTDDTARQGSFSAGECDLLADVSGFTSGLDTVLEQADAQGQTMFFSSGDTGSQCPAVVGVNGVPVGIPDTSYPASSPYGIAVGGTSVLGSGPTEIAWYAGGGGLSPIEPTPAFQSGAKLLGAVPLARRGVPDVSLDADPESGYDVVVNGTIETIGGTSASAPSWQGIWARAQGAHGGALSFAGPILYSTEPSTAYNDITIGANGLYTAGPGYDLTTGLGTPNITSFVNGA